MPKERSTHDTIITRASDSNQQYGEPDGKACLIKIYPAASPGEGIIELPPRKFIIGREGECDLEMVDSSVSRQHACIQPHVGNYMITDLGSSNGTFVNNERITKRLLASGDFIRLGTPVVKFLWSSHIETEYHQTLYAMMKTDGLTGIYNRQFFLEMLDRELARTKRHHRPLSVAMFDIDHFKRINDTYGHLTGDVVLRELCNRIKKAIRQDEIFARYGGEEFVVMMPESNLKQAAKFGERIRALVANQPVMDEDISIPVTISVGLAHTMGDDPDITATALIDEADKKLYAAKTAGRNCVFC